VISLDDEELDCIMAVAAKLPIEMRSYYLVALAMASRVVRAEHICKLAELIGKSHLALADRLAMCTEGEGDAAA
jgi:hypothetical protein